jgi:hypothetical protein
MAREMWGTVFPVSNQLRQWTGFIFSALLAGKVVPTVLKEKEEKTSRHWYELFWTLLLAYFY